MSKKTNPKGKEAMPKKEETALAVLPDDLNYPILKANADDFGKIIERNVGSENLNANSFQRIKIPPGGGSHFQVPDFDEIRNVESFRCVLLYKKKNPDKAFWSQPFGGASSGGPPDCGSLDGKFGTGKPGGNCSVCPLNQWGSGQNAQGEATKGKRCRDTLLLFPVFEGEMLPFRLALPPTSINNFKQYGLKLASYFRDGINGLQYFEVVTEVSLEIINKPVTHSRAVFKVARDEENKPIIFGAEKRAHLEKMIYGDGDANVGMQSMFESTAADAGDYDGGDSGPVV